MAGKVEQAGVKKAHTSVSNLIVLSVLAGAFVSLGAVFATTVSAGAATALPYGLVRLLTGLCFSLGLILVVVSGAELFTGNNLIIVAWASGQVSTRLLLRNWVIVYLGNFAGAIATAGLIFLSRQFTFGSGSIGAAALSSANAKVGLDFVQAIVLGALCNALVCLAIWMTYSARSTTDRILAIIPPVTAFVAAGFEHSIANMYYLPLALFIKSGAPASFWTAIGKTAADFPNLTWGHFFLNNLLPVTIGNVIGGALMVGAVYWFVYRREAVGPRLSQPSPGAAPAAQGPAPVSPISTRRG